MLFNSGVQFWVGSPPSHRLIHIHRSMCIQRLHRAARKNIETLFRVMLTMLDHITFLTCKCKSSSFAQVTVATICKQQHA
jgi:hypothetical protein